MRRSYLFLLHFYSICSNQFSRKYIVAYCNFIFSILLFTKKYKICNLKLHILTNFSIFYCIGKEGNEGVGKLGPPGNDGVDGLIPGPPGNGGRGGLGLCPGPPGKGGLG